VDVKADGQDQPITGNPSVDTMNVRIVDDKVVETTSKKGGNVVSNSKITVSSDGNQAVAEFTSYPSNGSEPITSKVTLMELSAEA
jgi:hypothetical protein